MVGRSAVNGVLPDVGSREDGWGERLELRRPYAVDDRREHHGDLGELQIGRIHADQQPRLGQVQLTGKGGATDEEMPSTATIVRVSNLPCEVMVMSTVIPLTLPSR